MRKTTILIGIVFGLGLSAVEAVAAEARTGRSGLAVGIFLAFCALIVVAQLLPALRSRLLTKVKPQQVETETAEGSGGH